MINVGIDITATMYARGVSRYTSNLVRHLLKRQRITVTLYGSALRGHGSLVDMAKSLKHEAGGAKAEVVIKSYPPALYNFLWNRMAMPKLRGSLPKIDVFHSWDWVQPPDKDLPLVSTIHDLAILKYPETAHAKIRQMHMRSWKVLKERNANVIAVSRATRNDIISLLEYPPELVHVVHEALPEEVVTIGKQLTEEMCVQELASLQLTRPFILAVGTREPRKNLERLIEAWQPLKADVDLVIAGEAGWDKTSSGTSLHSLSELKLLGKVTDAQLAVLYSSAKLFAYPSLYEGFGLPILEAFYFGTSVLASNTSSIPEVAGNAALLVNPLDVTEINQGLVQLLNETDEQRVVRRQRMIIRQHMFSWNQSAEQTEQVYALAANRAQRS